jgi:hypothetical protein
MALLMDEEDVVTTTLRRLCKYNVSISRNKVKSHGWQQQLRCRKRGCSGSCICRREVCCRRTGNRGGQEAPADGNGEGSEDDDNKGDKESEGDDGEGDKSVDGNIPKGGGRRWTQQSTKY